MVLTSLEISTPKQLTTQRRNKVTFKNNTKEKEKELTRK